MTTLEIVQSVLEPIYGSGSFPQAGYQHIAKKVDAWPNCKPSYHARDREQMILHTCWDFFTGGGTAEIAARRLEEALVSNTESTST